jgi:hypothetical protein
LRCTHVAADASRSGHKIENRQRKGGLRRATAETSLQITCQRSNENPSAGPALDWATETLRGAVQAVQPVPPLRGTGIIGYRPADYLDQHGRHTRRHQIGPPDLRDALAAHTASTTDLNRLGRAAERRGLYRHAAALWTSAAAREARMLRSS